MGQLVNGVWHKGWIDTKSTGGAFVRADSVWRDWVTPDGAPGPTGDGGFAAETGRYHLYVSLACPWAHRTLIYRALKGLAPHIAVSVVHPDMLDDGWTFEPSDAYAATGDRLTGKPFLRDVYLAADPQTSGRVTVPVLWDTRRETIVSNESADIIRMFDGAFAALTGDRRTFRPDDLAAEIDALNARIYDTVNNGVYKAGFATTQEAYEAAVGPLFDTLDRLEVRLGGARYLTGDRITEADWRLFPTLIRFDAVYHGHFKCSLRRIADYPNLSGWLRELHQWPGIAETVHMPHIRRHYHYSHESINPHRIVPVAPDIDLTAPHGRDRLRAAA